MTAMKLPGATMFADEVLARDGERFLVHTNGHAAVYRRTDEAMSEAPSARALLMTQYLSDTPVSSTRCDVAELRAFLGDPAWETEPEPGKKVHVECDLCVGSGRKFESDPDCTCDCCACEECDGEGGWEDDAQPSKPETRDVLILGKHFNANLVACALAIAGAQGECTIWLPSVDGLMAEGDGWRIVVMAMRTEAVGVPAFEAT